MYTTCKRKCVVVGFKADSTSTLKADSSSGSQHVDYVKTKIHEAMVTSNIHPGNDGGVTSSRPTSDVTSSRPVPDRPEGNGQWQRSRLHPMDASTVHNRGIPIIPGVPDSSGNRATAPDSSGNNTGHPMPQEARSHQLAVSQAGQNMQQFSAHSPAREDMVSGSRHRSPRPSTQSQSSDDSLGAVSTVSSAADDVMNASSSTQVHRIPGGRGSPAMIVQDAYGRTRSPRPSYPAMMPESSTQGPGLQAARRSPKITPGPGDMVVSGGISDNDPRPSSREAQASYHPHPLHAQSPHARQHSHSPRASIEGSPSVTSQGHERMDIDENSADSSASRRTGSEGSRPGSRSGPGYATSGPDMLGTVNPQDADSRSQHGRSPQPSRSPHHLGSMPDSGSHHTADSSRVYMGTSHHSPASSHGRVEVNRGDGASTTSSSSVVQPSHSFNQNYMYPGGSAQRHSSASNSSPQEASPAPLLNPQYETLSDDES